MEELFVTTGSRHDLHARANKWLPITSIIRLVVEGKGEGGEAGKTGRHRK